MDGFIYPVESSMWQQHTNNTSEKQYLESNGDDSIASSLLINEDVKFNADSAGFLPVSNTGGCEMTNLPLDQMLGFNSVPEQDLSDFGTQNLAPFNNDINGINGLNLPSFGSGSQMGFSTAGFTQTLQMPHQGTAQANSNNLMNQLPPQTSGFTSTGSGFDGTFKPRVRARRGQATDPHSIAERLRREKISERMKNLQELVPNSNRTDKASMLDEIIDYVKFLQLQVKVLSMSRLGATEAVVPLLTESQSEGSTSGLTSVSTKPSDQDTCRSSEPPHDGAAFEQEVIRLMESNVTSAMQYLQNKGLCLMPIALASAINTQKGTSGAAIPDVKNHQRRNSGYVP
ncbi:hypothetical protein LUZ60_017568 [Juncus effusus]|nr:hypothetical protein LUZ60_017568 [Juncus effusus]